MCSHEGIPVVTAFMLQMPCFPSMLFAWLSTSHLIWVESSSFQSNMVIILPICHSFRYSLANLAEPLAFVPTKTSRAELRRAKWSRGKDVWTWIHLVCDLYPLLLQEQMSVLDQSSFSLLLLQFWHLAGHTFIWFSACKPDRKLSLERIFVCFSWMFYWVNWS